MFAVVTAVHRVPLLASSRMDFYSLQKCSYHLNVHDCDKGLTLNTADIHSPPLIVECHDTQPAIHLLAVLKS